MQCEIHGKEFKGPNARGNMWHVINYEKGEFCNKPLNMIDDGSVEEPSAGNPSSAKEFKRSIVEKEEVDWDAINRGKVRCQVAVAFIRAEHPELNDAVVIDMEKWVDYIMNGPKTEDTF